MSLAFPAELLMVFPEMEKWKELRLELIMEI